MRNKKSVLFSFPGWCLRRIASLVSRSRVFTFMYPKRVGGPQRMVWAFSLCLFRRREIVISARGYDRQTNYDTTKLSGVPHHYRYHGSGHHFLSEIVIVPFPQKKFLSRLYWLWNMLGRRGIDKRNFNEELMALMLKTTPMDGYQNQRIIWITGQIPQQQIPTCYKSILNV